MQNNISPPVAVAVIVIVLLIAGVAIWRGMAPKAPPPAATAPYAPGGHIGYPPPTPLPPGVK